MYRQYGTVEHGCHLEMRHPQAGHPPNKNTTIQEM